MPGATITVTGAGDTVAVDGAVTLREAIASINGGTNVNADVVAVGAYGTSDAIHFAIGGSGTHTIQPASQLLITVPVTIDGFTQPGSHANTLAVGNDSIHLIEIDGTLATAGSGGVLELAAANCVVRGLVVNRESGSIDSAIHVAGASAVIAGNFVGIDPGGTIARSNTCVGVRVNGDLSTVGGPSPADRNVVSATTGCGSNVVAENANNIKVWNNYVGTNASGTAALGGTGIYAGSGTGFEIGGSGSLGNLISGNGGSGILITNGNVSTMVDHNLIGTKADGVSPLPNGIGIQIIGGTTQNATIAFNTIAYNTGAGIALPSSGTGNRILSNKIFSNGSLGIDLGPAGVTPNDPGDVDTGPNNLLNYPVLTLAVVHSSGLRVAGSLSTDEPSATMLLEFFWSSACDGSGYGEGANTLGTVAVPTDGSGNLTFDFVLLGAAVPAGSSVTATVTDPAGNTSEFSACAPAVRAPLSFYPVTPCRLLDTRNPNGAHGGPALVANTDRTFVAAGFCGVPSGAEAVILNVAVTLAAAAGDLRLFPAGSVLPLVSAINYRPARARSDNAIAPLGPGGDFTVHVDQPSGTVHLIVDVVGYYQ
jgi:hypothetical protein